MGFDSALVGPLASGAARLGVSAQDEARLQKAFVNHYAGIWRFLRRLGVASDRVDDAAQHAFLVALEALPRIVPGCERAFLYSTAVRIAHGLRRRGEREVPTSDAELGSSPLPSPDELTDQKRARDLLDRLLEHIELDARAAFVLFENRGAHGPRGIADLLGVPLGTAASRLRRAREQFQALVEASRATGPASIASAPRTPGRRSCSSGRSRRLEATSNGCCSPRAPRSDPTRRACARPRRGSASCRARPSSEPRWAWRRGPRSGRRWQRGARSRWSASPGLRSSCTPAARHSRDRRPGLATAAHSAARARRGRDAGLARGRGARAARLARCGRGARAARLGECPRASRGARRSAGGRGARARGGAREPGPREPRRGSRAHRRLRPALPWRLPPGRGASASHRGAGSLSGDRSAAAAQAKRFSIAYPASVHAGRVEALLRALAADTAP